MLQLRNQDRYGTYKAYSPEIGECQIKISICGWGDSFECLKDEKRIFYEEQKINDDCEADWILLQEDNESFRFQWTSKFMEVTIKKIQCRDVMKK